MWDFLIFILFTFLNNISLPLLKCRCCVNSRLCSHITLCNLIGKLLWKTPRPCHVATHRYKGTFPFTPYLCLHLQSPNASLGAGASCSSGHTAWVQFHELWLGCLTQVMVQGSSCSFLSSSTPEQWGWCCSCFPAPLPLPAALGDVSGLFGAGKGAKRCPGSTLCGETKKIAAAERGTPHWGNGFISSGDSNTKNEIIFC